MKLVSKPCSICQEPILFQTEGTWCEKCQIPFHKKCIGQAKDICPKCQKVFVKPEEPLNLKNKKWHEGVAKYPKEYLMVVVPSTVVITISFLFSAWYFLSKTAFVIFIFVVAALSTFIEALFTPLLWKFDDWFLGKIEKRKRKE